MIQFTVSNRSKAAKLCEFPVCSKENVSSFKINTSIQLASDFSIKKTAPKGLEWGLRKPGESRYRFVLGKEWLVVPDPHRSIIKVPDATPGVIAMYALSDEQALLPKLR